MRLKTKKTKFMVVSWSLIMTSGCGDLTLDGAELGETKSLRILGETLDSKLTFVFYLREVVSKAASRVLGSCAEQEKTESYLIVHVCSRAVSMHMFCLARSIVPPCRCCRRSFIWG